MPLAATGTGAAEPASNGARTTRRRRSRGRRPRGSSTGTATGYPETPAAAGIEDGADVDDHDDHEDIEDDAAHVEASEARRESGPAPEHGESTHGGAGADSSSGSPERAAAPPERPFSLFSWIRREAAAPSTPPAEPPKEDPER